MTASSRLGSGLGWRVDDVVCNAGPRDRPFEERHDGVCMAAVTDGTFRYRSTQGAALLAPGAVLLGNDRECYECSHEHAVGDRCMSFHFTSEFLEHAAAEMSVTTRISFTVPALPPVPALLPIIAAAEAARDESDAAALEELALAFAGAVSAALAGTKRVTRAPSRRDERKVAAALRRIEGAADEPISLADLAGGVAASPGHFLRIFRQVAGMTPYQFVLRTRLHRAAIRLRRSDDPVSTIAFEAGFSDLSTFNRRFRRIMGCSPSGYRGRR